MFYELVTPLTKTETFSQYNLKGDKMNERNLKHFTAENAKENGSRGGKASGEAKREKKKIREIIAELMEQEAPANDTMFMDYKLDFASNMAVIATKLIDRAKRGEPRAIKLLLEITGELDRSKVNVNVGNIEETEAYQQGYNAAHKELFELLTDLELCEIIERLKKRQEQGQKPEHGPLVLPNGTLIYGESMLKD